MGISLERIWEEIGQTESNHSANRCCLQVWGAVVVWKMLLDRSPKTVLKSVVTSPLTMGTWFTVVVTVLGVGYAAVVSKPSQSSTLRPGQAKVSIVELAKSGNCQTLVTDPNPPLNIRSSPVAAKDNVVGNLANGTLVTVINENQGWLQISQPKRGWIYENLTVTTCNTDRKKTSVNPAATESPVVASSVGAEESRANQHDLPRPSIQRFAKFLPEPAKDPALRHPHGGRGKAEFGPDFGRRLSVDRDT